MFNNVSILSSLAQSRVEAKVQEIDDELEKDRERRIALKDFLLLIISLSVTSDLLTEIQTASLHALANSTPSLYLVNLAMLLP